MQHRQARVRVAEGAQQRVHALKREGGRGARRARAGGHAAPLVVHQRRQEGVCAPKG